MTSPIKNLGSFDVVGPRKDGGLDLVISCSGPLDGSEETLRALRGKMSNYLQEVREARDPTLLERYGCDPCATIRIIVSCAFSVDLEAVKVIEGMKDVAMRSGVELLLKERM